MRRRLLLGLAALALAVAVLVVVLAHHHRPLSPSPAEAQLARRVAVLQSYAARERFGSLLPRSDAVIALGEAFLQSAVARSLPFRQEFERGRYVARLDSAVVTLQDGLGIVRLAGRGMLGGRQDSTLGVDLLLTGVVSVVEVDPADENLTLDLTVTDASVRRAGPAGLTPLLDPVARFFTRLKIEDWNRDRRAVRLPIKLEREIVLPGVSGDVRIPEARVPACARVSAVTTLDRRMAVSLALEPDSAAGERPPDSTQVWNATPGEVGVASSRATPLARADPAALSEAAVQLLARVRALAQQDTLWRALAACDRDVAAVVPASVVQRLTTRVLRRYLRGIDIDLRPRVRTAVDQELRVKLLGGRVGAGHIKGTVDVTRLLGRLEIGGDPAIDLHPPCELAVSVPVQVVGARGVVGVDMRWDPALLASLICRGFAFRDTLAGEILPLYHDLTTRVRFSVLDSSIVGTPRVGRDRVRIAADLTPASWEKVRAALVEQDRLTRCGVVMNPDDVLARLRQLAARGLPVRLPAGMFQPFRLPVALQGDYAVGGCRIRARAFDPEIVARADYLRIAFRARLRVAPGAGLDSAGIRPSTGSSP